MNKSQWRISSWLRRSGKCIVVLAVLTVLLAAVQPGGAFGRPPLQGGTASTAQGQTVTYTYDEAGRLVRADYGNGKAIAYTYDAAGNLLRVESPSIYGDLDGDCDVDVADIMAVASRWATALGHPNYDPRYDLDSDGDIDVVDIMLVAAHWGDHC
ncbi:MAG: hypothetical protein FJ026_13210 [Chloroflexi bacterium]|nr:hypothetical protein [Chloroflexota bacterium]